MSDAESTTDPRTDPGWTSVARSEDFGVTVEVGHIDGTYFWVEVAWSDDDFEQVVDATTLKEFKALLNVSSWPFEPPADTPSVAGSSMEDPRTGPGWTSIARREELGIAVELGRNAEGYFCVESIWGDENAFPISVFDAPADDLWSTNDPRRWSTTDPRKEPGWSSHGKRERAGITAERGEIDGAVLQVTEVLDKATPGHVVDATTSWKVEVLYEREPDVAGPKMPDPRTDPGWTSIAKSEELGMTVELGRNAGEYFWIEVARRHLVSRNTQSTPAEFKALHARSAHTIDVADIDIDLNDADTAKQAVQTRLDELLHDLCKDRLDEHLQLRLDGRVKNLLGGLTDHLEELIESAIEDGDGIEAIEHPAVVLWHQEVGAGSFWDVWRVGNHWFHWSFPGTQSEGEFSVKRPYQPPTIEIVPFSDWGLRNDVGPFPRAGTFERIGVLEAWNDSWVSEGEVAPRLEIVRRTTKKANGQILVLEDRIPRLSWGVRVGSQRVASFASIDELLAAIELPTDWCTSGVIARFSICEPYYSLLSEPGLPLCADHRMPSILLGDVDPYLDCMTQLCLHLKELT